MNTSGSQPSELVTKAIRDWLELQDAGDDHDPETFIARYPDIAPELRSYIKQLKPCHDSAHIPHRTTIQGPRPTIDGYHVFELIGAGGMGIVYKAHFLALKIPVALKMFSLNATPSDEDRERFLLEYTTVARLSHPNIIRVYDANDSDHGLYYSMEYVNGPDLGRWINKHGALTPPQAANVVQILATGIQHAHNHNIVHRDLKPANILLKPTSPRDSLHSTQEEHDINFYEPTISDFGLAKALDFQGHLTTTGDILGTPEYMAPEQAAGLVRQIGPQTDVYALGAILYCLLTSRPPHSSSSPLETGRRVVEEEPISPRALDSQIPVDVETICLKCLEKNSGDRYASAAELAD